MGETMQTQRPCAPPLSRRETAWRSLPALLTLLCLILLPLEGVEAQTPPPTDPPESEETRDFSTRPIFVNLYVFQVETDATQEIDLTDQIFRMRSSSLSDHERWMRAFSKVYPGTEISLLKQETRRVYRTSKAVTIPVSRQVEGRTITLELNGAQSPGDGVVPGTSLVSILNLQFGNDVQAKPISYGIIPIEVEHGMTYFYLAKQMALRGQDYIRFMRPQESSDQFLNKAFYLLFGLAVDLDATENPARLIDERQSVRFQEGASKKVDLTLPETIEKRGLSGLIRVRVEIGPTGTISRADVAYSTLPEANLAAMQAARQWEFPTTLFATDPTPITAYLTFTVPQRRPAPPSP